MQREEVTGVVLAGGQGLRLGGNKGLIQLAGRPLMDWVVDTLRPQVARLLINVNDQSDLYHYLGGQIVTDNLTGADFAGPLAGVQAALEKTATPYLVTVPCDVPCLPRDWVGRLGDACKAEGAEMAVAVAAGREQPVIMLLSATLKGSLDTYLAQGGRKVDAWYANHRVVRVPFEDEAENFININTPQDLQEVEMLLKKNPRC